MVESGDTIDFEAVFRRKLAEQQQQQHNEGESSGVINFEEMMKNERGRAVMADTMPLKV